MLMLFVIMMSVAGLMIFAFNNKHRAATLKNFCEVSRVRRFRG